MSLQKEVMDSHKRFIKETDHKTSGASKFVVKDGRNDLNAWRGLRRPEYYARVKVDAGARQVPSDYESLNYKPKGSCLVG